MSRISPPVPCRRAAASKSRWLFPTSRRPRVAFEPRPIYDRLLAHLMISPGRLTPFDPGALVRRSVTIFGINRYPPHFLYRALQFLARHGRRYPFHRMLDAEFDLSHVQEALEKSKRREVQTAIIRVERMVD